MFSLGRKAGSPLVNPAGGVRTGASCSREKSRVLPQRQGSHPASWGSPPAPSGTAYLLARKQAYLQQRQAQEQQQQELAVLQQLWPPNWPVQRGDPQSGEVLRLYFLLTPAEREVAAQLTQTWLAEHPHWQLDWSPPLPPYHFVEVLRDLSR